MRSEISIILCIYFVAVISLFIIPEGGAMKKINLSSGAFTEGGVIPTKHTCDGADLSPALKWEGIPKGAKSIALICDDPDAPAETWVHWVIFNIPAGSSELKEGVLSSENLPDGSRQGKNDFRRIGYGGPCPPPGNPHRYYFKLYALDSVPDLKAGSKKAELLKAIDGHILAEGSLMGKYARK